MIDGRRNSRFIWQGIAAIERRWKNKMRVMAFFFGPFLWPIQYKVREGSIEVMFSSIKLMNGRVYLLELILLPFSLLKLGDNLLEGVIVTLGLISAPAALLLFSFSFIVAIARMVAMFWDRPVCNRETHLLFWGNYNSADKGLHIIDYNVS